MQATTKAQRTHSRGPYACGLGLGFRVRVLVVVRVWVTVGARGMVGVGLVRG